MTVVAQLGIGARAKMQMAATGDRGFRLAAIAPAASCAQAARDLVQQACRRTRIRRTLSYGPFNAPLTIKPPGRR